MMIGEYWFVVSAFIMSKIHPLFHFFPSLHSNGEARCGGIIVC